MNDKTKYVFFEGDEETGKIIMNDLINKGNVKIIYKNNAFKTKIKSKIFNIHMSQLLNRRIQLPLKKIWFKGLIGNDYYENNKITFVFIAGWFNKDLHYWLRKSYPNSKQVMFLRDTVNVYEKAIPSFKGDNLNKVFDLVISYNPGDCSQFGFIYSPVFISKFEVKKTDKYTTNDIVFIGHAKDRLQLIHKLYEKLVSYGLKCDFYITGTKDEDKKYTEGINYAKNNLTYEDYLKRIISSDYIVDIIKGDTQGGTYRYWEAVYYNKKLITNWKGIKDFQFYDERYMMYFENVEDICIDFFNKKCDVEYNYNGENSPIKLLEFIEMNLSNRNDSI